MRQRKIAIALLCLGAWLAPASQAPAATPAPAWKLNSIPLPTHFVPGLKAQIFLDLTNVGGGPTTSPVMLTDTLPDELTPISTEEADNDPASPPPSCEISDQTVTCTASSIGSGRHLEAKIIVEVDPLASEGTLPGQAEVSGGGALPTTVDTTTTISNTPASFGLLPPSAGGPDAPATEADGGAATAAGSHPYQLTTSLGFPTEAPNGDEFLEGGLFVGAGHPRDISVDLPRGLVIDPSATPVLCTEAELITIRFPGCPAASAIGTVTILTFESSTTAGTSPLYNMVPPPGAPASFGFDALGAGIFIHLTGSVRSDGDYGLSGGSPDALALTAHPLFGARVEFWGDPSSPLHDKIRGACIYGESVPGPCPVEDTDTAFLTMPSECSGKPYETGFRANSWQEPDVFHEATYQSADFFGNPVSLNGCNALDFEPRIEATPTTNLAESPTGLDFHLHQPQDTDFESRSAAPVKDISVALPEGMTLNPAAADGIAGCSSAQIGLKTAVGETPIRLSKDPANCPDASRIGTLEVTTPALSQHDDENKLEIDPETGKPIPDPLFGSVYLAQPFDNPFDSLLAVYIALEDEKTGIIAKVPAKITADPQTGQLVTRISENPQLPLEDVRVHFFGGARAPLITPPLCGTHTTTTTMTPWTSPEGADAHPSDSFATTASPGGGSCATSPGAAPKDPAFSAGTLDPVAGAYSPFVMKLSREDATQHLTGVQTTLPPGLIGKLAGVGKCSEAQIAGAKAREVVNQGAAELASPSCPASSEVGTVDVSAGAGPTPLYVKARAYLAGPYKGAPLSLVIITPAVAGPFDLGAVVLRVALDLDSASAKISAVSDPIPTILEGIPLDVRGASIKLDRPQFTLNPTSCDPMAITGLASTLPGQQAALHSPFQVGGCSGLGFKPKLNLRLKGGGTKRGGHPAFQAIYKPRLGDANVKGIVVRLPRSAFLDQAHIRTICTRVQFAAEACPKGAQYGYIKAWTPLLEEPLEGPVWLRSSNNKLPDLVFDLRGVVDVEVATRIDSVRGGIRASIESAPDAPLTKVLLRMQGQKKGLIINSRDICKGTNRAGVELDGQNGKAYDSKPKLRVKCGKAGRGKHKRR